MLNAVEAGKREDEEDCSYSQCRDKHWCLGRLQRVQDWKPMVNLHCYTH